MYCWNCGSENEDGARFCWSCGTNLQEEPEEELPDELEDYEEPERKGKKPVVLIVAICVILCLAAGGGFTYWYLTRDADSVTKDADDAQGSTQETEDGQQSRKETEETAEAGTSGADAVVDQIADKWNESSNFIMGPDCVKYSDDTRTDYYDQSGKPVRFTQELGDEVVTYLFDDNEEIIYASVRDASGAYVYYYYQNGSLICYIQNMERHYAPFEESVARASEQYIQNGKQLLGEPLSQTQKPDGSGEEKSAQDNGGYILPGSSTRLLTESEVSSLSKDELRLARNEIFARHGRRFDDPELQAYFDSKSWYNGTIDPDDFSESMLSETEKKNIDLIKKYE